MSHGGRCHLHVLGEVSGVNNEETGKRTGCFDECSIMLVRQEWIRKLAEELFQKSGNAVYIVVETLWISEVYLSRICHLLV